MSEPILRAKTLTVSLGDIRAVEDADVALHRGELTALVGPNGAGKTTLVRALAGILPFAGRIELDGRALASFSAGERARRIAYLPQGNTFHWPLTVATVAALGRMPHGDPFSNASDDDQTAVAAALAATETAALAQRAVTTLSGGERARVALARALATQASVLLADEPTVSLDPRHQLVVMNLLRQAARNGAAVLCVAHDLALAARFADRVVVMQRGRIVADAQPREALNPQRLADTFGIDAAMVDVGGDAVPLALRPL
jgi:iron complex transport system ATP-binding protein